MSHGYIWYQINLYSYMYTVGELLLQNKVMTTDD